MQNYVQQKMLNDIPIIDVAKAVGIHVSGKRAMCFNGHDQKTPSLTFSPDKNLWYCHGCGAGGANVQLVMSALNCSYRDAVQWLASHFRVSMATAHIGRSVSVRRRSGTKAAAVTPWSSEPTGAPDPEIYEWFIQLCPLQEIGRQYMRGRKFSMQTLERFNVAELTDARSVERLSLKEWGQDRLLRCGLLKLRDYGSGRSSACLVWWDHTLLFPFLKDGRAVYVQGRRLADDGKAKYVGLNGVPKPLFNEDGLKTLTPGTVVYVCEGIPDTLTALEMGMPAVGVLGAHSFKEDYVDALLPFRVVVVPDNDSAGTQFGKKVQQAFNRKGYSIEIAKVATGKDLTEYRANTAKHRGKGKLA